MTANETFAEYNDMPNVVLLGRADDDLYVYDTETKKYDVLDFTGKDVMEEYDTFDAMFEEVVGSRMVGLDF